MIRKSKPSTVTPEEKAAQDLGIARKNWEKKIRSSRTIDEEVGIVIGILANAKIRGGRVNQYRFDSLTFRVERGWSLSADININFNLCQSERIANPDDPAEILRNYEASLTVGWSCTTRDVAAALAAVNLYKEVVDLAAEIQTVLNEREIRSVEKLS